MGLKKCKTLVTYYSKNMLKGLWGEWLGVGG
jgi:hypothetical protein